MPASNSRRQSDRSGDENNQPSPEQMGGNIIDRRLGLDRRKLAGDKGESNVTGLERRRGRGRRLSDFTRAAEEGEMTTEQFLFLMAIDAFKKSNNRAFPTWSDVLEVVRLLGYRKTMPSDLNLANADDWREPADAPSGVRPDGWERRFRKEELEELEADLPEPEELDGLDEIEEAA